jgi:phospholipid N-methyltransferase
MQKLFVAPAWTPEREDALLELCDGEIGDEDVSLIERAKERAERFTEYSANRKEDAENAKKTVEAITSAIPLGQPILVGHHSERAARKDQERIENGMRKAVKMWDTSEYWKDRAKGAIRNAAYKKDPFATARRIKTIEAEKRKEERELSETQFCLKAWSDPNLTLERAKNLANYHHSGEVTLKDGTKEWSAWSALEDGKLTFQEVREQSIPQFQERIKRAERWISHCENRLAYERELLGDSGGIATDRVKPEVGGGCKCWVQNGKWLYIQKVNKVSVTVLDNWDNGGENFKRTVPFTELSQVMSKADVDAKRAVGQLHDNGDKTGFYLTDDEGERPRAPKPKENDSPGTFESMREQLREGVKVVVAPQLFPTPPELAKRMVELADLQTDNRVLEPSAGTGNILRELIDTGARIDVFAVEINGPLADRLRQTYLSVTVERADFLEWKPPQNFDRIIMNPPFVNGEDIKHIQHARELLKPGGKLVALCANGSRQQERLKPLADSWEELPDDTFKQEGTGVYTALLIISK